MHNHYQPNPYTPDITGHHSLAGTPLSTCVVLADSQNVRIYMRHNRDFHYISSIGRDDLSIKGADKKERGDKTFDHGGIYGTGRHRYEAGIGETRQAEIMLAHDLAKFLEKQYGLKRFKSLVLVASPVMLGEIRKALSRNLSDTIIAESNKQLMHYNEKELTAELLKIIPGPECQNNVNPNLE